MTSINDLIKDNNFKEITKLAQEAIKARSNAKQSNSFCQINSYAQEAIDKYNEAIDKFKTFVNTVTSDDELENEPLYNITFNNSSSSECLGNYDITVTDKNGNEWSYNADTRYLVLNETEKLLPTNIELSIYINNIDSKSRLYKICYLISFLANLPKY